jgi:uncharacterized membrane protein YccC
MKDQTRDIKYFFFSQSLSDGIRITLVILLPALICNYLGRLDLGLLISTGALCGSISDAPGPLEHRTNGMLYCIGFVFLMSLLTGFANHHIILLGLLILCAAFFFTMFAVYGIRASSVGIAALLIMILRMDIVMPPMGVITDSLFVLAGGIWYMLLALMFYHFQPYRQAQRSLGNCIHETSKLLLIKATLYDTSTDVNEGYKKLLAQQVIVNEKQDETRELLFKSKEIVKDSTPTGQALLITFTDTLDLYEQVSATWYDHSLLRIKFSSTGILAEISLLIKEIAWELDRAGLAIQSNIPYKKQFELIPALNELKIKIDAEKIGDNSNLVLKKILINLRNVGERADAIANHFSAGKDKSRNLNRGEYAKFVTHKEISWAIFRNNLSLESSVFRHSLRMMITLLFGFVIVKC